MSVNEEKNATPEDPRDSENTMIGVNAVDVGSEADAGVPLNRNQGVAFQHLRLVTPDGFTFDPAWLKYVRYLQNAKRVVDDVMEIVDSFTKKSDQ